MVDFTVNNTAPDLVGRDNNFAVELYFAPKGAGLTQASTSGWRRGGATGPGSYSAEFTTNVNSTQLGTTKVKRSFHINEQGAAISADLTEITPFGQNLINKTDLVPVPTYGSFTGTIAVSGGSVSLLTLGVAATIDAGTMLEITVGTGASQYKDYRRVLVDVANGTGVQLESALDEAPQDAAEIKDVESIRWKRGGVTLAHRSFLGVISGDNGDTLLHYAPDTVMTGGNNQYPDAAVGMSRVQFEVIPKTELIGGKKQPVLLEEDLIFGT